MMLYKLVVLGDGGVGKVENKKKKKKLETCNEAY